MYLSEVELINWRKFSLADDGVPFNIKFKPGLNIIVGENDAGKTAIIDAVRICLGTNSNDKYFITEDDFSKNSTHLTITCFFDNLSDDEESFFYEWLSFTRENGEIKATLRLVFNAYQYNDINSLQRIRKDIVAGSPGYEKPLSEEARNLLSVTYLKPLRDANGELRSGYRSRVSQIIQSLTDFQKGKDNHDTTIERFESAYSELTLLLDAPIINKVKTLTDDFFDKSSPRNPTITNSNINIKDILKRLELKYDEVGTGLGSSNLLFMALELILLDELNYGPQIALIEEVESHIHPQAQLRVLKHFENTLSDTDTQYILTTHSSILSSSVSIKNITLIYNNQAFSFAPGQTLLDKNSYDFLDRFLDATKINLLFAKGIIFVEGYSENILLPAIAELIDYPLYKYGISIVNIASIAFNNYTSVLLRKNQEQPMNLPISIVTDLDIDPSDDEQYTDVNIANKKNQKFKYLNNNVENTKVFLSIPRTLEVSILSSFLKNIFTDIILEINYTQVASRETKKNEWSNITDDLIYANTVYNFMVNRKVSKAIAAQKLARYLIDNKSSELTQQVLDSEDLKYLVDSIKHLTVGDSYVDI